jgi:PEP-CTERM motif
MRKFGFVGRLVVMAAFFMIAAATGARADVVTMDSFSVNGPAGANLFTDPFNLNTTLSGSGVSSGVTQNTSPPSTVLYNVTGSFSESGGFATLNTANGQLSSSPPPSVSPFINLVSASYGNGVFLRSNPLGTTGIFNLSTPSLGAGYGVELIDANTTMNGDIIGMRVFGGPAGAVINLVDLSRILNTLTIIDTIALDVAHDQIALSLALSGGVVTGSYAYGDGGTFGPTTDFANTLGPPSDAARFILPAFNAFAPVPEPGTLALFGSGLAGLFWLRRSKKEKKAGSRAV